MQRNPHFFVVCAGIALSAPYGHLANCNANQKFPALPNLSQWKSPAVTFVLRLKFRSAEFRYFAIIKFRLFPAQKDVPHQAPNRLFLIQPNRSVRTFSKGTGFSPYMTAQATTGLSPKQPSAAEAGHPGD